MAEAIIPFGSPQQSGLDPLAGAQALSTNVVVDQAGAMLRRPGVQVDPLLPSDSIDDRPVQTMHVTNGGRIYALTGDLPGRAYLYEFLDGAANNLLTFSNSAISAESRPVIAETEAILAIATGRQLYKLPIGTHDIARLGGDPPNASHVAAQNQRIIANDALDDPTRVYYSAPSSGSSVSGHEQWGAQTTSLGTSGFFTAEGRPDPIVAVAGNGSEIFVWGARSLEVFGTDATFVYAPVAQRQFGCSAPYSIVEDDQSFAWLDNKRRFVHSDGRSVNVISTPDLSKTLQQLTRVDDCFGYRVVTGHVDSVVWVFPTDGRSFAYQRGGGWSQWMGYDGSAWQRLQVNAHATDATSNVNYVGMLDGKVGRMTVNASTDFGDNIPAYTTTGFLTRDTNARKHCRSLRLVLRRGTVDSQGAEPFALVKWRDDEGAWNTPLRVSLGRSGDRFPQVVFRSLGVYHRRQWHFSFHGSEDFALVSATEEYEVLGV